MPAAVPIIAAVASTVVGKLLEKKPAAPQAAPAPAVSAPAVAPVADDAAAMAAKKKAALEAQTRAGRASTILSTDAGEDKLGG